jgi:hypothetical protein
MGRSSYTSLPLPVQYFAAPIRSDGALLVANDLKRRVRLPSGRVLVYAAHCSGDFFDTREEAAAGMRGGRRHKAEA